MTHGHTPQDGQSAALALHQASAMPQTSVGRVAPRWLRGVVAVAAVASATGGLLSVTAAAAQAATAGTVAGQVYEDYNDNGSFDTTASSTAAVDVGVAGVPVTVTDATGAQVGTGTTTATGTYSISVTAAATTAVRVQFAVPTGYTEGVEGPQSGGSVQFATLGSATAVDLGLQRPGDYSPASPTELHVEQRAAITSAETTATATPLKPATQPTIVSTAYNTRGVNGGTTVATADQTGSIWGIAQVNAKYAFTAAYLKRHAAVGPSDLGGIYLTNVAATTTTPFVTVANAGTSPTPLVNSAAYATYDWFHDSSAYPLVGTTGLGAMTLSPDQRSLYVVNLATKALVNIPLTFNAAGTPVAGTQTSVPLPTGLPGAGAGNGCDADQVRPFGVSSQNGALWVTLTCTGADAGGAAAAAALRGYVYRYDPTARTFGATPAFQFSLVGVNAGDTYTGCAAATPCTAAFNPWQLSPPFVEKDTSNPAAISFPQPLLSDVVFDSNGDMTIGIKDRLGDQGGYKTGSPTATDATTYETFPGGTTLRACVNAAGGYTLESNGVCGTRTGQTTITKGFGPGTSAATQANFYDYTYTTTHDHTSLGALLQLPGYSELQGTSYDPIQNGAVRVNGDRFLSNTNGANDTNLQLTVDTNAPDPAGGFGKAGGLGDLTALVTNAPLEIGDRVFSDTNFDGIQEAGELGIAGVTVDLFAAGGTTPIATAVTDTNGDYTFSNSTIASAKPNSNVTGVTGLVPGANYTVAVDKASDYATGGPLADVQPTLTTRGNDTTIDSNGTRLSATDDAATITTSSSDASDHSIDFGFSTRLYAVGDTVFFDSNGNGVQDNGETGVGGITATLEDQNGNPVKKYDGTVASAITTTAANATALNPVGHYVIDGVPMGTYEVQFSNVPPADAFTTSEVGSGASPTTDSNAAVGTGLTPLFTLGSSGVDAQQTTVNPAVDGTLVSSAIDRTIDAGLVARPTITLGDTVYLDNNHNGTQDAGDPGIDNVQLTVQISSASGLSPALFYDGTTVGPQTTSGTGAAAGFYSFTNLPPLGSGQTYVVTVVTSTLPAGDTRNSTNTGPMSSAVTSNALDFGYLPQVYAIGDTVFFDKNVNGVQDDAATPAPAGVTVTVEKPDGTPVNRADGAPAVTTTDSNGHYVIDDLVAGTYVVKFSTLPTGYTFTTAGAGTDQSKDSNPSPIPGASPIAGLTPQFTLGALTVNANEVASFPGDTTTYATYIDPTIDAGLVPVPSITLGDTVYSDNNENGVQDPKDTGLGGVKLDLSVVDAQGNLVTKTPLDIFGQPVPQATTGTGANAGIYSFTNLPVLTTGYSYVVTVESGPLTAAGYSASPGNTGLQSRKNPAGGSTDNTLDFGYEPTVYAVGNYVFYDKNGNGIQDGGDTPVAGVVASLVDPTTHAVVNKQDGTPAVSAPTNANGFYVIDNVPAGTYDVQFSSLPQGYTYTAQTVTGAPNPDSDSNPDATGLTGPITLDSLKSDPNLLPVVVGDNVTAAKTIDRTLDAGLVQVNSYTLGSEVYVDANRDGSYQTTETGISGVTLRLTLVDAQGISQPFTNIFGNQVPDYTTGSVKGVDPGFYSFPNLKPLDPSSGLHYVVTVRSGVPTADAPSTTANTGSLSATGTANNLGLNFGYVPPVYAVGNYVFYDKTGNGIQPATPAPVAGVTVTLEDTSPAHNQVDTLNGIPATTTTDANGYYVFDNIVAGNYVVAFSNLPQGYVFTTPSAPGATPANDSNPDVTTGITPQFALGSGTQESTIDPANKDQGVVYAVAIDRTIDAGIVPTPSVTLGSQVFLDNNRDGSFDGNDTGVNGVTVTVSLVDASGAPLGTVTTDIFGKPVGNPATPGTTTTAGNGTYSFPNLPPPPSGDHYVVTEGPAPAGDTLPAGDSGSRQSALTGTGVDNSLNFPLYPTVYAVGDTVFYDTAGTGIQSATPSPVAGVTVTLVDPTTGATVAKADGKPAVSAPTGTDGKYVIDNLLPGIPYQAVFSGLPTGYTFTTPSAPGSTPANDSNPTAVAGSSPVTGVTPTFTLGNGTDKQETPATGLGLFATTIDPTIDAGLVLKPSVTLGSTVYSDTNQDGKQDNGETGINGVTVTLTSVTNGVSTPVTADIFGPITGTATTTGNGTYSFPNLPTLPAGSTYVVTVTSGVPTGDTPNATAGKGTLSAPADVAGTNNGLNFGYLPPTYAIGNQLFKDDGSGIQAAVPVPVPGVTVTLLNTATGLPATYPNGSAVAPQITDADGHYVFDGIYPGTYQIVFSTLPTGYEFTTKHATGSTPANDSDANPLTLTTDPFTIGASDPNNRAQQTGDGVTKATTVAIDPTIDAGLVPITSVSLGDKVFADNNHDGIQDAGDTGIPGVTLTLSEVSNGVVNPNVNDIFGKPVVAQTSAADGSYAFSNLTPLSGTDTYVVTVDNTQPALTSLGYSPAPTGKGTPATDSSNGTASSPGATNDDTLDFGFIQPAVAVGDFIWNDLNHNGIQDSGEPGIPNVVVTLTGPSGGPVTDINGKPVGPQTTNAAGGYVFAGLPPLPTGASYTVNIDNTQPALAKAGFIPAVAGAGTNRALDSSTGTATSGPLTTDGNVDLSLDFGFVIPTVSVSGVVFTDTNSNGVQDPGEPGISGVTVTLTGPSGGPVTDVSGNVVPPQVTGTSGTYSFTNLPTLPAGQQYTVTLVPAQPTLAGSTPTTPVVIHTTGDLTKNGTSVLGENFGFAPPVYAVGDYVFNDANRNGVQDANEHGVKGVTVTLLTAAGAPAKHADGTAVTAVTTDANGHYVFDNLLAGSYKVAFSTLPAGYTFTLATNTTDQAKDSNPATSTGVTAAFTLGATAPNMRAVVASDLLTKAKSINPTIDAGIVLLPSVSVGDFVWRDNNGNGLQDSGDRGIGGVTVTITGPHGAVRNIFGKLVGPTTTNKTNGRYLFANLPLLAKGQHYVVHINNSQSVLVKGGYKPTKAGIGGNRAVDSSTGSAASLTLYKNQGADLTLDFGFVGKGPLGISITRPTQPTRPLSFTGADVVRMLLVAGLLLGMGVTLTAAGRRRRRTNG